MRSLRAKIKSVNANNDKLVEAHDRLARAQEMKVEVNVLIL